jgi:tetratricopeptide (TPR) repeat protein
MTTQYLNEPPPFDYWLEYLAVSERWEEAWIQTYDIAIIDWQIELCWRLLREARRLAISPSQQAQIRYHEGRLHAQTGEWQRAAACYEFSLVNAAADDQELRLSLLSEMGMLHRLRGEYKQALRIHRRQYTLAKNTADLWHQAEALDQIGLDYEAAGRLDSAQKNLEMALHLWQQIEADSGVASTYKHLGLVSWRQGNMAVAKKYLKQAHEMALANEQFYDLAQIEGNLGNLAYERDELDIAEAHYATALLLFDELDVVFDKIGLLNNLAGLAVGRDQYEQAGTLYAESLALSQALGHRQGELDALLNLSVVALRTAAVGQSSRSSRASFISSPLPGKSFRYLGCAPTAVALYFSLWIATLVRLDSRPFGHNMHQIIGG